MSVGILRRTIRHRPSRRKNLEANKPQPANPIRINAATPGGSILTLYFDQPVSLNGTPAFTTDIAGATPISAQQIGPDVVAITFSAAVATATTVNVGYRDPAIRSSSGGYVIGTVVTI